MSASEDPLIKTFNDSLDALGKSKFTSGLPSGKAVGSVVKTAIAAKRKYKHVIYGIEKFILKEDTSKKFGAICVLDAIFKDFYKTSQSSSGTGSASAEEYIKVYSKRMVAKLGEVIEALKGIERLDKLSKVIESWRKISAIDRDVIRAFDKSGILTSQSETTDSFSTSNTVKTSIPNIAPAVTVKEAFPPLPRFVKSAGTPPGSPPPHATRRGRNTGMNVTPNASFPPPYGPPSSTQSSLPPLPDFMSDMATGFTTGFTDAPPPNIGMPPLPPPPPPRLPPPPPPFPSMQELEQNSNTEERRGDSSNRNDAKPEESQAFIRPMMESQENDQKKTYKNPLMDPDNPDAIANMRESNIKHIQLCRMYIGSGKCLHGLNCHLAHSQAERNRAIELFGEYLPDDLLKAITSVDQSIALKTKMCNSILNGLDCKYGNHCTYAHSEEELSHNREILTREREQGELLRQIERKIKEREAQYELEREREESGLMEDTPLNPEPEEKQPLEEGNEEKNEGQTRDNITPLPPPPPSYGRNA